MAPRLGTTMVPPSCRILRRLYRTVGPDANPSVS
jgi:hypothetical protein